MRHRAPRSRHGATTISDVARELGMSVATVSRALSRPGLLRRETRERVLAMVERLGYHPNLLARGLRRGKTHAILFVVPNLSPFFLEIYAGAEEVAREADFALLLGSSHGDLQREQACFDQVTSGRADGIILLTGLAPAAYASGKRALPPLVSVLERLPDHAVPVVRTDHRAGAREATRHLIELGHRRIAHIAGSRHVPSTARRLEGYRSALESGGLAAPPELVYAGDFTMQSGAAGMEELLSLDEPPSAVLCANDEMAFGAIRRLRKLRLSVPDDLSIVGFDDQNLAAFYNPPLTTVHIPRHELGRRGALELIKQLEGRSDARERTPDGAREGTSERAREGAREGAREVVLPTRLVIRESTAPPAARAGSRAARRRRYRGSS